MVRPSRTPARPSAEGPARSSWSSWPFWLALLAGLGALAAGLAPLVLPREKRAAPAGEARIQLGETILRVDPAFLLRPEERRGGRMAEAHLAFDARSLGPAEPPRALAPGVAHANPDMVRLILKAPDPKLSPAERTERLYLRHLDPDSAPSAAGLSLRRFAQASPYAGEDLHFTPPDGALFAARCERARDHDPLTPACVADLRVEGLDARLEFKLAWLEDWENLARVTREAVAGMKQMKQEPAKPEAAKPEPPKPEPSGQEPPR